MVADAIVSAHGLYLYLHVYIIMYVVRVWVHILGDPHSVHSWGNATTTTITSTTQLPCKNTLQMYLTCSKSPCFLWLTTSDLIAWQDDSVCTDMVTILVYQERTKNLIVLWSPEAWMTLCVVVGGWCIIDYPHKCVGFFWKWHKLLLWCWILMMAAAAASFPCGHTVRSAVQVAYKPARRQSVIWNPILYFLSWPV